MYMPPVAPTGTISASPPVHPVACAMSPWLRPRLAFILGLWVACCPIGSCASTVFISSGDPAIDYVGVWEVVEVNSTTTFAASNTTGSKALYTFTGTTISVFGVVLPRGPSGAAQVSEYSVDGSTPTQYTAPGDATAPENLEFYSSNVLPNGQHTLTIVNGGEEFIIEHLEVTTSYDFKASSTPSPTPQAPTSTSTSTFTPSSSSSHPSSSSQSTSTLSSNGTLTSTDTSVTPSSSPASTASSTQSQAVLQTASSSATSSPEAQKHISKMTMGAIIGVAAAGSFSLVLVIIVGCGWCRRKRNEQKRAESFISSGPRQSLTTTVRTMTSRDVGDVSSSIIGPDPTRIRRGPPIYIPVDSGSDLFVGGRQTQYAPWGGPGGGGGSYQDEKYEYGMDDVQLRSPSSASNLFLQQRQRLYSLSPAQHTFPTSPTPMSPLETPVEVRRWDQDPTTTTTTTTTTSARRRSADGGVRLAGGPPGQQPVQEPDDNFLDLESRRNTRSTLPPAYGFD